MTARHPTPARPVDVAVIGAGQAGLSAGYHLRRRGFVPVDRAGEGVELACVGGLGGARGGTAGRRSR